MEIAILEWYPSSCPEAKRKGYKYYFNNKPCKRGHVDIKHVKNGCPICQKLRAQEYYQENKESIKEKTSNYYHENKEHLSEKSKEWRERNLEHKRELDREYYKNNSEIIKARAAQWRLDNHERALQLERESHHRNKHKKREYHLFRLDNDPNYRIIRRKNLAMRRARQKQAIPSWEDGSVSEFYRNCPEGYHVDHIVPIQSKYVCGLHSIENLQYLTPTENRSKNNWWWPDCPDYFDPQVAYNPETKGD